MEKNEPITTFALLPTDERLAVTANINGVLSLYSLSDKGNHERPLCISYAGHKAAVTTLSVKGSVLSSRFMVISSLDSTGIVCFWRVDSIVPSSDATITSLEELAIGEFKLQLLERIDLSQQLEETVPLSLEIDPKDSDSFMIMAEEGIYRNTRIITMDNLYRKYQFKDLMYARPTALAISDEGIFLVGFDDGSLGLYSQHYTIPLSIWQNIADGKIVCIKWSSVYFDDISKESQDTMKKVKGSIKRDFPSNYKNNLNEFYLVDEFGNFQIWNLAKLVNVSLRINQ